MKIEEFVDKTAIKQMKYISEVDHKKAEVRIFFEDGNRATFQFAKWFYMLEAALQIIEINEQLCREK